MNFPDVQSREEFLLFLAELRANYFNAQEEWENASIPDFLESLGAWIDDKEVSAPPETWRLIAQVLFAGSRYE